MCWACHERELSGYRACDGCGNLFELQDLQEYDLFKQFGELAEFVDHQKRVVVFCVNCREAMNDYRDHIRQKSVHEQYKIVMPKTREVDRGNDAITVAIKGPLEGTIGLSCAREIYGHEAVREIEQGFVYRKDGFQVKRVTLADTDETQRCERCWLKLWICNGSGSPR